MNNFETHPKSLKTELLTSIHMREMALPDFQRDFVWQPGLIRDLIISLAKGFPAGSLLRIENNDNMAFAPRAFKGAPDLDHHQPRYLVLDGQQRLTSLYQALYGTGEHLYYVNLEKLRNGYELEDAFYYEKRTKGAMPIENQIAEQVLPLQEIFGGDGFYSWITKIERITQKTGHPISYDDRDAMSKAYQQYIEPIVNYNFPVVTLSSNTTLEAVCTIFETLNSTGVRLSVFDLLSARSYARNVNLRQLWDDAKESSRLLVTFDVDPYYLLQVISSQVNNNSIKRSDVLNLTPEIIDKYWHDTAWGMAQALDLLTTQCGVLKPELLSYSTILVPMAAVFSANRNLRGPAIGALRNKVLQWYWCSVFNQRYESNPTSQSAQDIGELLAWVNGGETPKTVKEFKFIPETLYTITTRQRAVYRGVHCLILKQQPLDFYLAKPITMESMKAKYAEDHHVFPAAYLSATTEFKESEINCILNRTYIDQITNASIGKKPPSEYLQYIERHLGRDPLDKVLKSHLLPAGEHSSLRNNDFQTFREERAAAINALIQEVTSSTTN